MNGEKTLNNQQTTPENSAAQVLLERRVMCGDLLLGVSRMSCNGIEDWFVFPRYKVVAIHMDNTLFFAECLNHKGENMGYTHMDIVCDQWKHLPIKENMCAKCRVNPCNLHCKGLEA